MTIENTTQNAWPVASMTPSAIDAIVRKARAERGEHVRVMAAALPAKLKRFVAGFRPISQRTPRTSALA